MSRAHRIYAASLIWSIAGLLAALAFALDRGPDGGARGRKVCHDAAVEVEVVRAAGRRG